MPKTVLHIAEAAGGVERYLVTLLTKMNAYPEFEHILVCSSKFDEVKFKGIVKAFVVVKEMQNAISMSQDLKSIIVVRKIIKRYKPDIIYCHSSKAGAIGRVASMGCKNKIFYNAHGWSFNMKGVSTKKIRLYENIERILASLTDKIVCISEYEKISAIEHKICKDEKLVVINNGIDFDEFDSLHPKSREELGIAKNAFVVGMIGRLATQKAPDIFVKMAKLVKERIPNAFFIIVGDDIGDGRYYSETKRWILDAGLEKDVMITGWVDNPLDYGSLFNVAVLLSRWEGFGMVLPEYMFMGKPIVATKVDAIPHVIGGAGLLVGMDDYKSAAESVVRIHKDKELRNKLIQEEKKQIRQFDAKRTAYEHAKLWRL